MFIIIFRLIFENFQSKKPSKPVISDCAFRAMLQFSKAQRLCQVSSRLMRFTTNHKVTQRWRVTLILKQIIRKKNVLKTLIVETV